jgi:dTDP-4-dehydrorhamnose 3,5-epimerase
MSLQIKALGLDGVLEILPPRFEDDRGFFSETWNAQLLSENGVKLDFVQDNHSRSIATGVLRGLHYQLPPYAQDKLVRVVKGSIFDVAVDIRRGSPSFAHWTALRISASKWNQVLVPKGFAHGFLTLEPDTEVIYKVTSPYSASHSRAIRFDDPDIGIIWPTNTSTFQLSDNDRMAQSLANAEVFDMREEEEGL